ncbi:HAD family hydrolase [bacterium]|nr:HAD family hydrolase [bacterium]MCI0566332.1 HAD family hydrolase [bacterium]
MNSCIIFDCNNTLLYKTGLAKTLQEFLLQKYRKDIPLPKLEKAFRDMYERRKLKHPTFADAADRERYYSAYNQELCALVGIAISSLDALNLNKRLSSLPFAVYDDVIPTLELLKKTCLLGVLANWTNGLADILKEQGISRYFNFIYSSHDLGMSKPDTAFFERGIAKANLSPDTVCYYVGDDYELDVLPARKAGLRPILIDRKNLHAEKTDCIKIRNLELVKKLLT